MRTSLVLASVNANAASLSFTGTLSDDADDADVRLVEFSVSSLSEVTLRTYSYGGGVQANGNTVLSGGFDLSVLVFDSSGSLEYKSLNDTTGVVTPDISLGVPISFDDLLSVEMSAGSYTAVIFQEGLPFSNLYLDSFLTEIEYLRSTDASFFTSSRGCSNGQFCDLMGSNRTNEFAFDIINVDAAASVVPVPASVWLFSSGLIGLFGFARNKGKHRLIV